MTVSVGPHVCFVLVWILVSMFLGRCIYELGIFHANQTTKCLRSRGGAGGEGWSNTGWLGPRPGGFVAGRPRAALLFWFFGGFGCGVPLFIVMLVIY